MLSIEGNIVTKAGVIKRRVEIDEVTGVILKVAEPTGSATFVYKDELIFPGFIDLHVHAREDVSHKNDYKEDFKSAGEASINGGVVLYGEMPNCPVAPIDDASYDARRMLAEKSEVPVMFYAGIGPNTKPLSKKVPYKVFMGHSVGELFFTSLSELEKVVANYQGENISFHAEDPEIMESNKGAETHGATRPKDAEISAVDFAISLIEKYNLVGKICHASTIEAVNKIYEAKKRGVKVTMEVTPHHLYFDETQFAGDLPIELQVNPPIRGTKENRLALIEALRDGRIDYLATDHAPHTIEEKQKGISGLTHLDTYGAFTTWLMSEHNFRPEDIARVCAESPGGFVEGFVEGKYGKIEEGYMGSLTIINPNIPTIVTKDFLKTKNKWSPFLDKEFTGSVVSTIIKGKIYEH